MFTSEKDFSPIRDNTSASVADMQNSCCYIHVKSVQISGDTSIKSRYFKSSNFAGGALEQWWW